ncbi:MAG: hypothetical protein ACRYGR_03895 [Janthinobacterium lividum]
MCLRAFKETTAFDQPRWHMDGCYYESFDGTQLKFAIVFKGPSTLFYPLSFDERQKFTDFTSESWQKIRTQFDQSLQQNTMTEEQIQDEKNRLYEQEEKIFLSQMIQKSQIISLPSGQGMIFKVGNLTTAALHSEPPIKEDRLFLSIVPCGFKDISGMRQRLGKKS